ncbi:MAG: class I SAM-dependent methyltransferase [Gammaproteobacteria bacterium]|nr:class I SAM-dependent methyltransferase [Gammaproteobacteria bacterium]
MARRQPHAVITRHRRRRGHGAGRAEEGRDGAPLTNVSFRTMPAEHLDFADASFDKALCRFGVMLFEDPLKGCREIHRVLKPGGAFAFAVWARGNP